MTLDGGALLINSRYQNGEGEQMAHDTWFVRTLVVVMLSFACSFSVSGADPLPQAVTSLSDLIAQIPTVARGEAGIGSKEQELAKAIQSHGADAIPLLLPLLEDKRSAVRNLTGYIIRDTNGLTEKDLDALIAAQRSGNGWVPLAIGRIATPRAIRFLIEELRRNPSERSNGQVFFALERAGGEAAALLTEPLTEPAPVGPDFSNAISEILKKMGASASSAVGPLVEIALDPNANLDNKKDAVLTLGALGRIASDAAPQLKLLAAEDPDSFSLVVQATLVRMGVSEQAPTHFATPAANVMPPHKVTLMADDGSSVEIDYPSRPCVEADLVNLIPGERILVEADVQDKRLVNLRRIERRVYPERTLELEFNQVADQKSPAMMTLSITNPFSEPLTYEAGIQRMGRKSFSGTSTVPVHPGRSSYEFWPYTLTRIALRNFRLADSAPPQQRQPTAR